jgi:hypothetical protein
MKVLSNKMIASGSVYEDDTMSLAASIYETVYASEESGSGSASGSASNASNASGEEVSHYVVMSYKNLDADEEPMDSLSWADVMNEVAIRAEESGSASDSASAGAGLVVPNPFNPEENFELVEPKAIRYAKTKSFVSRDAKGMEHINVYCAMRYTY